MEQSLLIALILSIIVLSMVYKFAKKLFKLFLIIFILLIAASAVTGYLVVKDISDLKQNLPSKESLIVITDQEQTLAAFQGNFEDIKNLRSIDTETLKTKTEEQLLQENYKIITIDVKAFETITELNIGEQTITKTKALEILTFTSITQLLNTNLEINLDDMTDTSIGTIKAFIIASMLKQEIDENGLKFLIQEYKNKNIDIRPQTITFKLINLVPTSLLENV